MSDKNTPSTPRRKSRTPGARINRVCLICVLVLFAAVAALNLFQFNRPTVSETERRKLAAWPEFSWQALGDGSYFSGISEFIKDTFWQRDGLISFAQKMESLKGFSYQLDGEKYVVAGGGENTPAAEETTYDRSAFQNLTLPPVQTTKEPAQTTAPTTVGSSGESTSTPAETTAVPFSYLSLTLSPDALALNVDGMLIVSAQIETVGEGTPAPVSWSLANPDLADTSVEGNSFTLMGKKEGTTTLTATVGSLTVTKTVTVSPKKQVIVDEEVFKDVSGYIFYYGGGFYHKIETSENNLKNVSTDFGILCDYYKGLFGSDTVSFMPCPHAAIQLDTQKLPQAGTDQNLLFQKMGSYFPASVNFINAAPTLKAHVGEYLYFKGDHHWTHLGAYYGYTAWAQSMGITPTPLDGFDKTHVTDTYEPYSYFNQAYSLGITDLYDTIETYHSRKKQNFTAYYTAADVQKTGYTSFSRSDCIMDGTWQSNLAFMGGDRPMAVIDVPENNADGKGKNVLVIRDSYGRIMNTYLVEHYAHIVSVDPRYYYLTFSQLLQDQLNGQHFDDILFVMSVESAYSADFMKYVLNIVSAE